MQPGWIFAWLLIGLGSLTLILELGLRLFVERPLRSGFYGSIPRDQVRRRQQVWGLRTASGPNWGHLGWIADPEQESYRVERRADDDGARWEVVGRARYGSYLLQPGQSGVYRVWAICQDGAERLIGEARVQIARQAVTVYAPRVAGAWQVLFKPEQAGSYINDHTLYQDAQGRWRLIGITSPTRGDYNQEKWFAAAVSDDFPPPGGMRETDKLASFGELAWAPHVVHDDRPGGQWHIFWSPHTLRQMSSPDGVNWGNARVTLSEPFHKFFRDGMVYAVADGQWLLYCTARGAFYSRIDVYQSFDLQEWQYIGAALESGAGSERNAAFASMESPSLIPYQNGYYLSWTYNNETGPFGGLLMPLKVWLPRRSAYNDTRLVFSANPYRFGVYRGTRSTPNLVARIEAHAPEYVYVEGKGWFITTAGWPWVSTLTPDGSVKVAPLSWTPQHILDVQ